MAHSTFGFPKLTSPEKVVRGSLPLSHMITLSSDFGSPYPAAMKGVLLRHVDTRLVDVSHDFPRQDIRACAFWLAEVLPEFPPAVHLVVVDPGVGTDRAALAVRAGNHALIGPDNGVVMPVARTLADGDDIDVYRVVERELTRHDKPATSQPADEWPPAPTSSTFHGRDVFAPAAARVHQLGIDSFHTDVGFEPIDDYVEYRLPNPTIESDSATGEVLAIDEFGNVITNIPGTVIDALFGGSVVVNGQSYPVRETYARIERGNPLVTVGSHGNVELSVNQGRGNRAFDVSTDDDVRISW